MSKAKFFRDPLHQQIRLERVDLSAAFPAEGIDKQVSWVLQNIIDTEAFQRLRLIRQNGLANYVFHGAEHSRFSHSMGVSFLARRMYEKLCYNSSIDVDNRQKLTVAVASLIHDVGHGPFSHTLEDILKANDIKFHHEDMTLKFINDESSEIFRILNSVDSELPLDVSKYFSTVIRDGDESFCYKIVSSQMDADRLDYVQRDALFSGIRGHGFDIERLLDLMFVLDGEKIAVHRGAIEALEAYLVTMDQMWRAVYYHHANRAASVMVTNLFRRAFVLHKEGDAGVFPDIGGEKHPFSLLFEKGVEISLGEYMRLNDSAVWALLDLWRRHDDFVLKHLSERLLKRDLLKPVAIDPKDIKAAMTLIEEAKKKTAELYAGYDAAEEYLFAHDDPSRTSYKHYDWKADATTQSIWLTGEGKEDRPIESDDESGLISALKAARRFDRIFVDKEIRGSLTIS